MDLSGSRRKSQPLKRNTEVDQLPPHSIEAEQGAIGCVLMTKESPAESDALLRQLSLSMFYDLRHKTLFQELVQMRMDNHVLDLITIPDWLKGREMLEGVGGVPYLIQLIDCVPSLANFSYYLGILQDQALRRHVLARSAELSELSRKTELSADDLRAELLSLVEKTDRIVTSTRPMIEVWTIDQAKAYVPDPTTFLAGADMISRGELIVMAGPPGVGKTRLANTFAFAGAKGKGLWMGYEIKRRFRTFVLQSENNPRRIQNEVKDVPQEWNDWVRFSLPCFMQFNLPAFRQELLRLYEAWPFDAIVIDNMNDVAKADAREDFLDALDNIRLALPPYPKTPALILLAHLRKNRGGEKWRPMRGRQLLNELSGSFALGAKARTVFVLQPGSDDADDDHVVFDCAKSNNEVPLPASAWHRTNVEFAPAPDFDIEEWLAGDEEGRKTVNEETMSEIFHKHGPTISRKEFKAHLAQYGFAQSTAYRVLKLDGQFKDRLWETQTGRLGWK